MKVFRMAAILWSLVVLSGCSAPGPIIINDDFNNSTIIRQKQVPANSGMADATHRLGFEWVSSTPDKIYIAAALLGNIDVLDVAFNVDGEVIQNIKKASSATEFTRSNSMVYSSRRFEISLLDFLKIARAETVKMKISRIDANSVSTFGNEEKSPILKESFVKFLVLLKEYGAI